MLEQFYFDRLICTKGKGEEEKKNSNAYRKTTIILYLNL